MRREGVLAAVHETAVFRALRMLENPGKRFQIGYLRIRDQKEIDFVLGGGERSIGIEVTSSEDWRPKIAPSLELAGDFGLHRIVIVHGSRRRAEQDHVRAIGLEEFLLDTNAVVEEAFA
jgi:predicted AAA+ superfamily ATPase